MLLSLPEACWSSPLTSHLSLKGKETTPEETGVGKRLLPQKISYSEELMPYSDLRWHHHFRLGRESSIEVRWSTPLPACKVIFPKAIWC